MDTKEFKTAIGVLVKEKGISEDVIIDAMKLALTSAYKKNYHSLSNVRVDINEETGNVSVYSFRTVVPDNYEELEEWNLLDEESDDEEGEGKEPFIFDERIHIPLTEAREIVPGIEVGDRENPAYGIVTTNRVEESKYPSLYAFLKYASATSTT